GAFEPFVAEEPTPRHLVELKKIISEKNITAIFVEPQISSSGIQGFAEENNLAILTLDPLGGTAGKMTYRELMRYNVSEVIRSFTEGPMP
ncbi:MAG: zinc ABC transporter substrate-binding protein, partial [Patescibacteria group bacterium]